MCSRDWGSVSYPRAGAVKLNDYKLPDVVLEPNSILLDPGPSLQTRTFMYL